MLRRVSATKTTCVLACFLFSAALVDKPASGCDRFTSVGFRPHRCGTVVRYVPCWNPVAISIPPHCSQGRAPNVPIRYFMVFKQRSDGVTVFDSEFATRQEASTRVAELQARGESTAYYQEFAEEVPSRFPVRPVQPLLRLKGAGAMPLGSCAVGRAQR